MACPLVSRRRFGAWIVTAVFACAVARGEKPPAAAGRSLDFKVDASGFGGADTADIEAVIRSAAESIWRHCPNARWETPGFFISHGDGSPIILDAHRPDGRIAVRLTPTGNYWAQFAFQFAHEFCHALAGHCNDWHKPWIGMRKANQWLEESLCETASLFALRSMSRSWRTAPPYPNWKDYAPALADYAEGRIQSVHKLLSNSPSFGNWFHDNEPGLRQNATLREKNTVIAVRLLPIFEANPAGWEAMTYYNLGKHDPDKSLADQFADWRSVAPAEQREFIEKLSAVFGR